VDPQWLLHVVNGIADADVAAAVSAVEEAPKEDWFAAFVNLIESAIKLCDSTLMSATGQKSFGISIVLFTLLLKILTYPLTYAQLQSTTKMAAIQPKVKAIQARYQSNPEVMQREMSALYSANDVNPLAGCLPSIVQSPIFIGLYRALLKLSTDNLLNEPFLWLPNLEGPVYGTQTNDWLFKNWVDGAPSLGWHDTLCFCSLPVILIVMQSISQKLLQPPPNPNLDESAAASQAIIKYLPILFGFFALNVPSGLGVYWVTNTLFSTAATLIIKNQVNAEMAAAGLSVPAPAAPVEKPAASSFSSMVDVAGGVGDAEIVQEASPLREVEGFGGAPAGDASGPFSTSSGKKKKKKGGKK